MKEPTASGGEVNSGLGLLISLGVVLLILWLFSKVEKDE